MILDSSFFDASGSSPKSAFATMQIATNSETTSTTVQPQFFTKATP